MVSASAWVGFTLPGMIEEPGSFSGISNSEKPAMCESFFATLECELLDRRRFKTQVEARMAVFEFIEGWYNPHRRHSALDYLSPINYEWSQQTESLTASQHRPSKRGSSTSSAAICLRAPARRWSWSTSARL